jgi:hypothetical protein
MKNASFDTKTRRATVSLALASAIAMALTGTAIAQNNGNGHRDGRPFDRTFVAATASPEVLEAHATADSTSSEPVELLRTTFDVRPQFSKDLLIRVDAECAAKLDEDPEEESEEPEPEQEEEETGDSNVTGASVNLWVEVDGVPVAVSSDTNATVETTGDGSVMLCSADGSIDFESTGPEAIAAELGSDLSPSGFSWAVSDIGRGTHEVVVLATLDLEVEESGEDGDNGEGEETEADAMALIGQRILTIELAKAYFEMQAADMQ